MEGVTRSQAILHPLPAAALFLVLTVRQGGEDTARDVLADVPALRRAVGFRVPDDRLEVVVGVGSDAWGRLFSGPRPAGLHPFVPLDGGRHSAPSTPGDLLFHIRAATPGPCFELGRILADKLRGAADVVDATSTHATCWASSTAPRTPRARPRPTRPSSATRTRGSRAAATSSSRSTCTTCRRGMR